MFHFVFKYCVCVCVYRSLNARMDSHGNPYCYAYMNENSDLCCFYNFIHSAPKKNVQRPKSDNRLFLNDWQRMLRKFCCCCIYNIHTDQMNTNIFMCINRFDTGINRICPHAMWLTPTTTIVVASWAHEFIWGRKCD